MSRKSTDPQFVGVFERGAAVAANQRKAIATYQWLRDGFSAGGTIEAVIFRRGLGRGRRSHFLLILALLLFAGCSSGKPRAQPIGEAYVAPMLVNLRQELAPRAPVTATVKHGDRLEILERRRRFVKVRTKENAEGWTDGRQLLPLEGWKKLQQTAEEARKLPSQGQATPFDLLNVHMSPNRGSPSFAQIQEGAPVDLIGRAVTPRTPYTPEMDGTPAAAGPNALKDDWSLVRLDDDRSGWVLSRLLLMTLPDQVIQYAEGHRITSYFSLGKLMDRGEERHHYLWTTIAEPPEEYQFDSIRLFVWNSRKRTYETGFRERNLRGYYPVVVERVEGISPRIQLICAARDGVLHRRTYEFQGTGLKLVEKIPWKLEREAEKKQTLDVAAEKKPEPSRWEKVKAWWGRLRGG